MADIGHPLDAARSPWAYFAGRLATGLVEVVSDPGALERPGWWAVVGSFEGRWTCARFADVRLAPLPTGLWTGPAATDWTSSLDRAGYRAAVEEIRDHIGRGEVYQANLCRVLSAPLSRVDWTAGPAGLARRLASANPAGYAGVVHLPQHAISVVTASPELYLKRTGDAVESRPIKGTGRTEADLLPKDTAENVMIVDLVRNDLSRVAVPGSVTVPALCAVEDYPGSVHLVSTVRSRLAAGSGWTELVEATFPPGSVSGAPKLRALDIISRLETTERGPYCGAVGWVDADRGESCLAVAIRTFWFDSGLLRFGTGAGITWESDPDREWLETALKADRLISVASR